MRELKDILEEAKLLRSTGEKLIADAQELEAKARRINYASILTLGESPT